MNTTTRGAVCAPRGPDILHYMEDQELRQRIEAMEVKIDAVYKTTHKLYVIFMVTAIISVAAIILPLIGLVFALPSFLSYYTNISNFQL